MKDLRDISRAIDAIDVLQESHLESFNLELLPDLEKQCRERQLAVDQLAGRLRMRALDGEELSEESSLFFHDRISWLLYQNRMLIKKVQDHRDGIESSMKKIQAGKHIIQSYGSPGLTSGNPKVFSFTE